MKADMKENKSLVVENDIYSEKQKKDLQRLSQNKGQGDLSAMLVKYRPMVKIIVGKMRDHLPSHADIEELESVGLLGLINAVDRFDPELGYSFETYASIRIRGAILDELRNMDMMPRSIRTKQKKLKKTIADLEQQYGRAPSDEEIRLSLDLSPKKYEKMKAQAAPLKIIFLDKSVLGDEQSPHDSIADDGIVSCRDRLERQELIELVARKINELPEVQRKVLALYFFDEMRLAEIGKIMSLSEARVSQIRTQALNHLRKYIQRISD